MHDPKVWLVKEARDFNRYVVAAIKAKDWIMVISYQDDRDSFMRMARKEV